MTARSNRATARESAPFELKGSLFALTVLQLRQFDTAAIDRFLSDKIKQAPGFFQNMPVVIDLADLPPDIEPDFEALGALLRQRGLVPVGVRNLADHYQETAIVSGLAVLRDRRPTPSADDTIERDDENARSHDNQIKPSKGTGTIGTIDVAADNTANERTATANEHNRMFTQPVRSGQQIYAPNGDLIVLGTVSHGAEVLADGNIHVYGPLRGRALAGIKGDGDARIFCQSLEAQLVSVAGNYRILDEPLEADKNKAVQIFLRHDKLIIEPLFR